MNINAENESLKKLNLYEGYDFFFFFFLKKEDAGVVIEAGFVEGLHINISSFFASICSHVAREHSYFLAGFRQTCLEKENFSRVENLYFFVSFGNSWINFVDRLQ